MGENILQEEEEQEGKTNSLIQKGTVASTSRDVQDKLLDSLVTRDINTFCDLLKNPQVDLNHKYGKPHWSNLLGIACQKNGCEEFVKALLESGVNPNINKIVPEPIHYAASKGHDDILTLLLSNKCTKVNAVDKFGRTALHFAAKNFGKHNDPERYESSIAMLVSRSDMDVNRLNKKGCTAIHEAAIFGGRDSVKAMLKHGSQVLDLDSSHGFGKSARQVIIELYPDLKNLLQPIRIEQPQASYHTQLLAAFEQKQINNFKDLLCKVDTYGNACINPNFLYGKPFNSTCLEIACKEIGYEEYVQILLLAGADPNILNAITKKTPLHLAVETGNHEALCILLQDKRIDVNIVGDNGKTPLHSAVEKPWECDDEGARLHMCVFFLLQHRNIDVKIEDKNGSTAIHTAVTTGNKKAFELMINCEGHEFDIGTPLGPEHRTTLDLIEEKEWFMDIELPPLQKRIVQENETVLKQTLFKYLYQRETDKFIQTFKKNVKMDGISLEESDNSYFTFLQYGCNYGLLDVVQFLLEQEVDPNATSSYNKTPPAILATCKQNYDILKCFLNLPAYLNFNINASDAKGSTALHYAAHNKDLTSIVALLSHGADIKLKNIYGDSPLPVEVTRALLDNSLKSNQLFPENENYELIFNYSFLLAHIKEDTITLKMISDDTVPLVRNQDEEAFEIKEEEQVLSPEMDMLFYFSQSEEHRSLLTHPVIASFLYLKWLRIKATYFTNLLLYILFLLLLNIYILMDYGPSMTKTPGQNSTNESTSFIDDGSKISHLMRFRSTYGNIIWMALLIILFCHTVRELFKFVMSPSRYLLTLDNMLDIALVFITGIVLFKSWEEDENRRLFTAFCLFLSWVELSLIIGRLPTFSTNIQMLKNVSKHYSFIFLSYFFIIIAFGVSFFIFYHNNWQSSARDSPSCPGSKNTETVPSFKSTDALQSHGLLSTAETHEEQTLWSSVTQAALFVAGGFSATFIPIDQGYSFIMLLLFTFIVIMVMINILTAIAVTEVKYIQDNAEQICIVSRITLLYETESVLIYWNRFMKRLCKFNCVSKMTSYLNGALRRVIIFPDITPTEKRISVLPNTNGKVIFPNEKCAFECRLNMETLKAAINIIGNKGNISEMEQMKNIIEQKQNEELQKTTECIYTQDKILGKIKDIGIKTERLEEDIIMLHNKVDKDYKTLEALVNNMNEQYQLEIAEIKERLWGKLDQFENRFSCIEQSQSQTKDQLTEILRILNSKKGTSGSS